MENVELKNAPPQELEAEQAVLGAVLVDDAATMPVAAVRPEDFYKTSHRVIFSAYQAMHGRAEQIDLLTTTAELRKDEYAKKLPEGFGIASYLNGLVSQVPTASGFKHHERLVIAASKRRALIRIFSEASARAYAGEDPDAITADAIRLANDVRTQDGSGFVTQRELVNHGWEVMEKRCAPEMQGKISGITTGFREIDRRLDGWHQKYYIVAGRPQMGKTAFAECCIAAAAAVGRRVGFLSLEMIDQDLALRAFARTSGMPLSRLLAGDVRGPAAWDALAEAAGKLGSLPVVYDFTSFSDQEIERSVSIMVQKYGVEMVLLDYLQLGHAAGGEKNREREISRLSRMVKRSVKIHRIPHVVLAQLSREVEKRPDKRPMLSDLRESGSLEQDADVVIFLYRDEVYNKCACPKEYACVCGRRGAAEAIIAKGRMEGTGKVSLEWHTNTTEFRDAGGVGRSGAPEGMGELSRRREGQDYERKL